MVKYLDFVWALDVLSSYYPKYYSTDIMILAEDILKWVNNELPEDSSALQYLKSYFDSPGEAMSSIWTEIGLLSGAFAARN